MFVYDTEYLFIKYSFINSFKITLEKVLQKSPQRTVIPEHT